MTLYEYMEGLKGKRVTVLGIGISNRPLIKLLLEHGVSVTARDRQTREKLGSFAEEIESSGCKLVLGDGYLEGIEADVIFRSPGIRPDVPQLAAAIEKGAVLTSEMEAFFEVCPCRILAVTGSDGKTTTTTVISEILKNAGYTVHVGGNIGTPLLDKADGMSPNDICVLELSSFQLMTLKRSPDIAVITNLAPNHLDVHKSMEEYTWAKRNIFVNDPQPRRVVLNLDNDITRSFIPDVKNETSLFSMRESVTNGVYLDNGRIKCVHDGEETVIMEREDIFLPGDHNVENYMAAFAATYGLAGFEAMAETARTFKGVEHRIEFVRQLNGIRFYNDSIASSPSRTTAGLRSFKDKVVLIAGGKDKGVPFDGLGEEICLHVKKLIVTGWTADKIKEAVLNAGGTMPIIKRDDFKEAVIAAYEAAESGDVVILSPACTSFDHFKNFEERGRYFKDIVNGLE